MTQKKYVMKLINENEAVSGIVLEAVNEECTEFVVVKYSKRKKQNMYWYRTINNIKIEYPIITERDLDYLDKIVKCSIDKFNKENGYTSPPRYKIRGNIFKNVFL